MSVEEIEEAITKLSADDLTKFRAWWEAFDADEWDQQIERDVKSGKLDRFLAEARAEFEAGLCRKI